MTRLLESNFSVVEFVLEGVELGIMFVVQGMVTMIVFVSPVIVLIAALEAC